MHPCNPTIESRDRVVTGAFWSQTSSRFSERLGLKGIKAESDREKHLMSGLSTLAHIHAHIPHTGITFRHTYRKKKRKA